MSRISTRSAAHPAPARDAFAAALTDLWAAAGNPTLERVASRSGVSSQRLSDWRNGRRVPDKIENFRPALEQLIAMARERSTEPPAPGLYDLNRWVRLWQAASTARVAPTVAQCPYRGLESFRLQDAPEFFGRDRCVEHLLRLLADNSGLHVLVGASGAGKSSLLQAGLMHAVANGLGPGGGNWVTQYMTPGASPLDAVAAIPAVAGPCLLVVDQFEETFTADISDADRREFVRRLAARCGNTSWVVIGLRADFYSACLEFPDLAEALQNRQMVLGAMTDDELRSAIAEPAAAAGLRLENGLVDLILSDLHSAGAAGVLPLMSHVLEVAWRRREKDRLTLAGYRAAGGVRGSVTATAEQAWAALDPAGRTAAQVMVVRLVQLGDDARDTGRHVAKANLLRGLDADAAVQAFETLAAARLLTIGDDGLVSLTHEIVIESWPRLREWLDADREGILFRQRLERDAREWDPQGRPRGLLWNSARLADVSRRQFAARDETTSDFVAAAAARRSVRRALVAIAAATVVVLAFVAVVFAVQAVRANDSLSTSRDDAVFRALVTEADRMQPADPTLAAQLYLVAHRLRPNDRSVETKLVATATTPLATPIAAHGGDVYIVAYSRDGSVMATGSDDKTIKLWNVTDPTRPQPLAILTGHTNYVDGLAFSPDGRILASGSGDKTVRLWDIGIPNVPVPIGEPITLPGTVYGVAFSPDGKTVAASVDNDTVELWNVSDPAQPVRRGDPLLGHTGAVRAIAYSPDGKLLASGSDDRTVRLWDVTDPDRPSQLGAPIDGFRLSAHAVDFSPDSRLLATAGDDGMVRLFDITDPAAPRVEGDPITAHLGAIWHIEISPDGYTLATGGRDGTAKLWSIVDPAQPVALGPPLTGSNGAVSTVAWSPDGRTLATGSKEGAVRLWNLATGVVAAHPQRTVVSKFSADGRVVATGSLDATVQLWRVNDDEVTRLGRIVAPQQVNIVAMNPAGNLVALTNSIDSTVRLYDITDPADPQPTAELRLENRYAIPAVFSPDGRILATTADDHSVRLWDVADPRHPIPVGEPLPVTDTGLVTAIAFTPDGTKLAASSNDRIIRAWDVTDAPRLIGDAAGNARGINFIAFAPDGATLASAGDDKTIRLWHVGADGVNQIGEPLRGHSSLVRSVAWASDGKTLVSGSDDQTVRLWDVTDLEAPVAFGSSLVQPGTTNWTVVFTPDGGTIMAAGERGAIRVVDLDPQHAIERICATGSDMWTEQVWDEHIPDLDFAPPCG